MKKLIIMCSVLIASSAFAAGVLTSDQAGRVIQGAAPSPYLQQVLTVNSTTINVDGTLWWSLYAPAACKYRVLPTSAKGNYPAFTVPATTPVSQVLHNSTLFVNFSGCALAELSRM